MDPRPAPETTQIPGKPSQLGIRPVGQPSRYTCGARDMWGTTAGGCLARYPSKRPGSTPAGRARVAAANQQYCPARTARHPAHGGSRSRSRSGSERGGDAHTSVVPIDASWPTTTARPLRRALTLVAAATALIGIIDITVNLAAKSSVPQWLNVVNVLTGWLFVAAGLLAWVRRPNNRYGFLTVAGGLVMLVSNLPAVDAPVPIAVNEILGAVRLAVLVHLLHAFPSGRLTSRPARLTVCAAYLVSVVLQVPPYLFTAQPKPFDLLMLADRPDLAVLSRWVQSAAGVMVVLATIVILVGRLRRAEPRQRRMLTPLWGYGVLAILFSPLSSHLFPIWFGPSPNGLLAAQLIVVALVPVAFTMVLLRGGFAHTGEVHDLSSWLGTAEARRRPLTDALAHALGDDSTRLLLWTSTDRRYVDVEGERVVPPIDGQRGMVEVELAGKRVGAIEYDTTLNPDPALVRSAGRVIAMAVDHERVTAELRASQQELRRSRARIVTASDTARRRIARDLHDGLQVRLVLLAMQAQQLATFPDTPVKTQNAAVELRVRIDAAAAELRDLVHAVVPAGLIERGLCAATEDLVDHLTIPTRLEMNVADHSLPAVVETTAYFVVAEALTNALKYAKPTALTVQLTQTGELLHIEISDDGIGGARRNGGTGLGGIADRVDTLGGRLEVHSPPGHGTRILAELPCVF